MCVCGLVSSEDWLLKKHIFLLVQYIIYWPILYEKLNINKTPAISIQGNSVTDSPDAGRSSDMKHRTVDGRDDSWSYSSRRDHSGFNGCCTAMLKANGKTTTLVLFLDSLQKKRLMCEMLRIVLFRERSLERLSTCRKTDYYLNLNNET
jgi:hypothetical protein